MAHNNVFRSLLSLASLLVSASAVPLMPFAPGFMGLGGMLGHGGARSHIGASFRSAAASFNDHANPGVLHRPSISPTVLNGVERFFSTEDDSLVEGLSIIIRPQADNQALNNPHQGGLFGLGVGGGAYGGLWGGAGFNLGFGNLLNPFGGNPMGRRELEAVIEVLKPASFEPTPALIVFTENAVTSSTMECPVGPVLTQPRSHGNGLHDAGFADMKNMLNGFGGPFHGNMGPWAADPDFGVVAEVSLQPGVNTFTIQGLGVFDRLDHLAGRGASMCLDVHIGLDGKPSCVDEVFACVKLGYTSEPEPLIPIDA